MLNHARAFIAMIDVPRRLRRAILLNDLPLVKRILRNNPTYLRNPDYQDKSNTSLHLAAKCGFTAIVEFLISLSHDSDLISLNNDAYTPLMLACASGREETGVLLARKFPHSIPLRNNRGQDALMLAAASGSGTLHLMPTLILLQPSILTTADNDGNTALHHASAAGELKALRMLLSYGAEPLAMNWASWTPVHYSATSAAESYFKGLIIEREKVRAEGKRVAVAEEKGRREEREREREKEKEGSRTGKGMATRGKGLVRLVTDTEEDSTFAAGTAVENRQRARDDAAIAGLPAPGMEWSPVDDRRRAMTPTEGRGWTFTPDGMRPRAETGGSI